MRWQFWAWILVAWPLSGGIAYLSVTTYREERTAIDTYHPVQARILQVELGERRETGRNARTQYWPFVSYVYHLDDKQYICNGVLPSETKGTSWWARGIADRFRIGETHTAYYDPVDPSRAFLVREIDLDAYAMFLAATFLFLAPFLEESGAAAKRADWLQARILNLIVVGVWLPVSVVVLGHFLVTMGAKANPNVFLYLVLAVGFCLFRLRAHFRVRRNLHPIEGVTP